jgi:hypothetical protein
LSKLTSYLKNIRGTKVPEIPNEIKERFEQWYNSVQVYGKHNGEHKDIALSAYIEAIRMMCVDATAYEEYQLYCCFDKPV